jgi:hypothetical protein
MTIEQNFDKKLDRNNESIKIIVKLENYENLLSKRSKLITQSHSCYLIIGNDENDVFCCKKIFDSGLLKNKGIFEINNLLIERNDGIEYINAHLISEYFVGLDVECKLRLEYSDGSHRGLNGGNSFTAFSDNLRETNTSNNTESCQHKCQDKRTCLHNCCKRGLDSRPASNKRNENDFAKQVLIINHIFSCELKLYSFIINNLFVEIERKK